MPNNPGVIPISSVINVSVNFASAGIANYNVNNIGLFTTDSFLSNPNTDLYRIYNTAAQVGTDFGTTTETYLQALNVFAQSPNILNGNGQLIIIPIQNGAVENHRLCHGFRWKIPRGTVVKIKVKYSPHKT